MMSVYLICVGKLKEKFYLQASEEYLKRLGGYCKMTLLELPEEKLPQNPSQAQIDAALEKEAANIRAKIPPNASLITLCVEGKPHSSEELPLWSTSLSRVRQSIWSLSSAVPSAWPRA